jgi:hypothetical protein
MISSIALGETGSSVLIILDCLWQHESAHAGRRTRLEAAKAAIDDLLGKLPADIRLGLRA